MVRMMTFNLPGRWMITTTSRWLTDKCVPLVREITFENAEELTEEGLPFLILFRKIGDMESEQLFTSVVTNELADQKSERKIFLRDS
jgi:endoplasmic reticulum resident protein 44